MGGAILKRIGIGVGAATLLVVAVGFLMPRTYAVERSLVIDASPERIRTEAASLDETYLDECEVRYADSTGGTRVTWLLTGDAGWNVLDRYLNIPYSRLLGSKLEDGLDRLKVASERPAPTEE